MAIEVTGTEYMEWFGPDRWGEEEEPTHFAGEVYTVCWLLTGGQLAVPHTEDKSQVTCPKCLTRLQDYH